MVSECCRDDQVPAVVGGGVVFYVTGDDHAYISNVEEREEARPPHARRGGADLACKGWAILEIKIITSTELGLRRTVLDFPEADCTIFSQPGGKR